MFGGKPERRIETGSPIWTSGGSTVMTPSRAVLDATTDGATEADEGLGIDAAGVGAAAEQPRATNHDERVWKRLVQREN